ncbi:MAG: serine/threonine-protein kinase [Xenococcaceae cyanobacterium]
MNQNPNYGRILSNRYQLAELVGEGAMGQVYRAKDNLLGGVTVAVKFLSQTLLNSSLRERFEREATICAILGEQSIHVVRVRDYGVDDRNVPFYVMEFLAGEGLSDIIQDKPLHLPRFFSFTRQICFGLEAAHQGISFNGELCQIIHRDIKPSNILVVQDPTLGELVKVLDFGIAKLIQANVSQTQSFMGTLAYCSPEQMEGKELDNRSDIYSLGVMMYEMLTGDMPILPQNSSFGGWYKAHREIPPHSFDSSLKLPKELEELVMRCLKKLPKDRPQSATEILKTLETIQKNLNKAPSFKKDEQPTQINLDSQATIVNYPSADEICLNTSWPDDKPKQKIVFARLLPTPEGMIPTICAMLDRSEINEHLNSSRFNQFLFLDHPYPLLLWITLIYNREVGPRWLSCYLDLKTNKGQLVARSLSDRGCYRILLFASDRPQKCQHLMQSTISDQNRKMLKQWADVSNLIQTVGKPQIAKQLLKHELEKIKSKIIRKLEASYSNYPSDISE